MQPKHALRAGRGFFDAPLLKQRPVFYTLLLGSLIFLLMACNSTPTQPKTSAPAVKSTPSPAPQVPPGTVLYQADWSHSLDGWQGDTKAWTPTQGQLQVSSPGSATLTAPYKPTIPNYAIEVRIQLVQLFQKDNGDFSIFVQPSADKDGYKAGVSRLMMPGPRPNGTHPQAQIYVEPMGHMDTAQFHPHDYEITTIWHTYRVEVRNGLATFTIDGATENTASSTQTDLLSNGPISLLCDGAVLHVSNFRIIAL